MFLSQLSTSSVSVKSCISSSGSSKPRKLTKHKHLHFKKQFKDKSVMSDFISRIVLTWQVETVTHLLTVTERVSLRSISSTSSRAAFASQLVNATVQCAPQRSQQFLCMAWYERRARGSLHMRPFDQQELWQPYPNTPTETGNSNSGALITGNRELSKTNYFSCDNGNLDQERGSRNQRGKLFYSFKQKLYKVPTRLLLPN